MTDSFALLGEPRRPWLDADALQARFLALAAEAHPDRFHNAPLAEQEAATRRSAALNAAHAILRDPKARLLHLLELERGQRPAGIEQAPAALMDLFFAVGRLCQEADRFQAERQGVTAPMLQVKLFARGLELTDRIGALQGELRGRLAVLEAELAELNAAWETAPAAGTAGRASQLPLTRLEEIARAWSFLGRWRGQLQERLVPLAT